MFLESCELEREINAYVIDGPEIYRAGYRAGVKGLPVKDSPHLVNDWRDDVWCEGWRKGSFDRLAQKERLNWADEAS